MSILEGLFQPSVHPTLQIDMSTKNDCPITNNYDIEKVENHYHNHGVAWLLCLLIVICIVLQIRSCSPTLNHFLPMNLLTRETIIKHSTFKTVEVDVTEWGEIDPETGKPIPTSVFVREMTAAQRDRYESSMFTGKAGKKDLNLIDGRTKMVIATACDADGNLIFQPEDLEWLREKPVRFLNRIFEAAQKLNGFTDEDEEEILGN